MEINDYCKSTVRRAFLLLSALLLTLSAHSQTNPKPGCIITTAGDTISGTIDYRTTRLNNQVCRFCAEGQTEYTPYLPGELSEYMLSNERVRYVRKTFPVNGQPATFFAECLVEGGVSLYRYADENQTLYFMEDQKGEVATVWDYGEKYVTSTEGLSRKNKAVGEGIIMLSQSPKACRDLWDREFSAKSLAEITSRYDEEYCSEAGDCITYAFDEKSARKTKGQFVVGLAAISSHADWRFWEDDYITMRLEAGYNWQFVRSMPHLSLQAMGRLYYRNAETKGMLKKAVKFDEYLGVCYKSSVRKPLSLFIGAGVIAEWMYPAGFGLQAGVEYEKGKHRYRLKADGETFLSIDNYYKDEEGFHYYRERRIGIAFDYFF